MNQESVMSLCYWHGCSLRGNVNRRLTTHFAWLVIFPVFNRPIEMNGTLWSSTREARHWKKDCTSVISETTVQFLTPHCCLDLMISPQWLFFVTPTGKLSSEMIKWTVTILPLVLTLRAVDGVHKVPTFKSIPAWLLCYYLKISSEKPTALSPTGGEAQQNQMRDCRGKTGAKKACKKI